MCDFLWYLLPYSYSALCSFCSISLTPTVPSYGQIFTEIYVSPHGTRDQCGKLAEPCDLEYALGLASDQEISFIFLNGSYYMQKIATFTFPKPVRLIAAPNATVIVSRIWAFNSFAFTAQQSLVVESITFQGILGGAIFDVTPDPVVSWTIEFTNVAFWNNSARAIQVNGASLAKFSLRNCSFLNNVLAEGHAGLVSVFWTSNADASVYRVRVQSCCFVSAFPRRPLLSVSPFSNSANSG